METRKSNTISVRAVLKAQQQQRRNEYLRNVALDALRVIALTPEIKAFLQENDPKALEQVELAINTLKILS